MDIPLTVLPWYRDRGDHRETDGQNKELKKVLKLLTQVNRGRYSYILLMF